MILSASRRTDIPALYPAWIVNRLRAGEILVVNPYNRRKVTRLRFTPESVDCIVFWTKNPEPLIPYLREIDEMGYRYCFQMTVTDYGRDIEPEIPRTEDAIATFLLLSEMVGKERIDWRFDPLLLTERYSVEYHRERFAQMCEWMHNATERCITSFVDFYRGCPYPEPEDEEICRLAEGMAKEAGKYGLPIYTCSEKIDLSPYGIMHGACIDKDRLRRVAGYKLDLKKDTGQRPHCMCAESIDVGAYDTCVNGCGYCYAVGRTGNARRNYENHDPESPLLVGTLKGDETVTEKILHSSIDYQLSLFD